MTLGKKMLEHIERNSIVRFILITAVLVGAFITIGQFIFQVKDFYDTEILVSEDISKKLYSISAGVNIEHFREKFGREVISESVGNGIKELLFMYKTVYIQTLINEDGQVIFYSATDCINPVEIYNPAFDMSYVGRSTDSSTKRYYPEKVILNKTSFTKFFKEPQNINFFISGATANSYYYEYEYGGNPGGYQTFFIGVSDMCKSPEFRCVNKSKDADCYFDLEQIDIKNLREVNRITTYGEMSGSGNYNRLVMDLLKEHKIYLGPDRTKMRVLKLSQHYETKTVFSEGVLKIKKLLQR